MKILHLGKYYSPIEGGIESINEFIVDSMRGNQQRVLSFNNITRSTEDDVKNVSVIRASSFGVLASQPISLSYYWELRRKLRQFKPDVVHLHYPNPLAAIFLLMNRKRYKLIVHWHSDIVAQKFLYWFIKPIERNLLKQADKIIVTSPSYRDSSVVLQGVKKKIVVIPCSIDEDRFRISEEDALKIDAIKKEFDNLPIIFFMGRHVEYKGIKYLLDAEKYVKSRCVFVIAGQGPLTDELKQKNMSSRIHWVGRLNEEQMNLYYHAASVFAFPSITRNEAFGVVLAESMYCGCPSVTFTIPGSGVNWVSKNEITGLEVANSDFLAYANAIDQLIENTELRKKLGENAQERATKMFTKAAVVQQYLDLYGKLICKH